MSDAERQAGRRPGLPQGAEPTYASAIAELEAILAELEDDALDVDRLAGRVARAAELIRLCRGRITGARLEVEKIVADLDRPEVTADPP